jgi:hypothetical protein
VTFKQFETVYTLVDVPAVGVKAGQPGTILDIYEDGTLEIEFDQDSDGNLVTISLGLNQVSAAPLRQRI